MEAGIWAKHTLQHATPLVLSSQRDLFGECWLHKGLGRRDLSVTCDLSQADTHGVQPHPFLMHAEPSVSSFTRLATLYQPEKADAGTHLRAGSNSRTSSTTSNRSTPPAPLCTMHRENGLHQGLLSVMPMHYQIHEPGIRPMHPPWRPGRGIPARLSVSSAGICPRPCNKHTVFQNAQKLNMRMPPCP